MASKENIYFLRSFLLLIEGGLYISKEILSRECQKPENDLDELLKSNERKLKHFHKKQYKKLYPDFDKADINSWDLQLSVGVLINVFGRDLKSGEKVKLKLLRDIRNDIYMHCTTATLDKSEYDDVIEDLDDIITTLASTFDTSVQQRCSNYIKQFSTGPLDAVRPSLQTLNGFSQLHQKKLKVGVETELVIGGPSANWISLCEHTLETIFNHAESMASEDGGFREIERNVKKMLRYLECNKAAVFKECKRKCIILYFECNDYESFLSFLYKVESQEYTYYLRDLSNSLHSFFKPGYPMSIKSKVTSESLQSVLIDIIKTLPNEEERRHVVEVSSEDNIYENQAIATASHGVNKGKQLTNQSETSLSLNLELQSVEALPQMLQSFQGKQFWNSLKKVADSLSRHHDSEITLKASMDVGDMLEALEDSVSSAVTVAKETKSPESIYAMTSKDDDDLSSLPLIDEKEHTLSKQVLDVKRYQECLGRPEGEVEERVLRLPEDIALKNVDAKKLKFLKHSNDYRKAIQTQLDSCYATIVWPEGGGEVILKCTLTNEVKDCFKLIKTWKSTAVENFEDFMKFIIVKKVQILQDIWGNVIEKLLYFNIENPEAVAVFVDKNESVITVVGNKKVAEDLLTMIEHMTKEVMAEIEKEREKIKENITSLKNIETRMLLADKFPKYMEQIFPDLKVKINENKNEILFEGPLGQVRDAKLKMYELKARFAVDRCQKISELAAGLLVLNQTKEHVAEKLKAFRVTAVWDTVNGDLEVYSTNQDQIQLCVDVIRSSVIERTIALKIASKTVVNSDKWQTKVDELHVYYAGKCMIKVSADSCKVQICATDDIANEILDNVKTFLRQNTVVEVKVPCTRNVHRLIDEQYKNEISNIAKGLSNYNVQISSVAEYGGFKVHGTEYGLRQAVQQLHQLLLKVKQKGHVMTKPGFSKHMQTPKGKDNLNTIESMYQSVVAVKGDYGEDEINDNPYETVPIDSNVRNNIEVKGVKIVSYSKVYECRNVYTMQGDMTELTVDMIVNSADDKISLTGGLGNAIVKKGGKEIQKECADYIRHNNWLDDGESFVSTAGSLKASAIVHVRGPDWRGGMKQEDEMLTDAVFKCLQQTSTRNLTSVAIPALSCGTYGYPVRKATTIIVAAVKKFFREVQESTVSDIYLCDMKTNIVEAFNEAMCNIFGASNVKKYVYNLDSMRQPSKRFSRADTDDEETYIKPMDTDEEDDDYYISSKKAPALEMVRPPQKTTKIGNIFVSVVKGEIAKQKVDVIVNTTAKNLDLKKGAVSASLLKTGGIKLQQEVSKKYPNGIKDGEIAVTSGQNLKCDIVLHCSLANWDRKKDAQCKQALHKLMKDCMDEAKNQGKTSIAFPVIGTGNLGFPHDIVATEMFSAVSKFSNSNPSSSLREVSFIVYQKDFQTIQAFEYEAIRWSAGKRSATGGGEGRQYHIYEDLQGVDTDDEETYINPIDIDEEDDYYYISPRNLAPPSGKPPPLPKGRPPQKTTKIGNISISVVKGEIAKQKVDVIVNTTAKNLDLKNGAVSASILKTGGMELQQEVSKKYPNGIKDGEIAVTSGQSLKCDIVVHCSLANWDRKKDAQCKQALHKLTKDCMDEAENQGKTSIAFPAIGTGNLGFPCDIVATEMFSAVSKFSNSNPSSSLREVSFIVYQKDFQTIQAFEDEARRWSTGKRGATGGGEGRQYHMYEDLQDDDDFDSDTFSHGYDTMEHRKIRKEESREADYVTLYTDEVKTFLADKVRIMKSVMFLRDQDMLENMMDVLSRKFLFTRRWNYLRIHRKRNADILISMVLTSPIELLKGFKQYLQDQGYDDIQTMIDSKSVTLKDITVLSEQEESSSGWRFRQTIGKPLLNFTNEQKCFLLEELENANDIAASLLSKMIISGNEFLKISLQPARRRGITVLLDILEKCPEKHLVDFYSALEKNGYNYMTDELVMIKQGQFEKDSKQEVETILRIRQEIKTKQEEYRHAKTKAQERHNREVFNPFELKGQDIKKLELLEPTLEQDKYKLPITKETIEETVATAEAIPNELDQPVTRNPNELDQPVTGKQNQNIRN